MVMQNLGAIVFGSLNMDLVTRVSRLPHSGETLMGDQFWTTPGGKGANQAVALAQLGVMTQMVGRVGDDDFGRSVVASLQTYGVRTEGVIVDAALQTGVAVITVADTGENQIIGVFGANQALDSSDVARLEAQIKSSLKSSQVLLLQLEVALGAVEAAAKLAHHSGLTVILDPAPVPQGSIEALYPWIDILVPNEVEASQLTGLNVIDRETAVQAARQLQAQGIPTVIVKLGAQGAVCATPEQTFWTPAFEVDSIDTVAAGDAFVGGLAAAILAGQDMSQAVRWGCAAGALATTKMGAQVAMATRSAVLDLLSQGVYRMPVG